MPVGKKNKRLIGYRKMAGFTQDDMALMLGINRSTYCNKENGRAEFTDKEMNEIHRVLNDVLKPVAISQDLKITDIFF